MGTPPVNLRTWLPGEFLLIRIRISLAGSPNPPTTLLSRDPVLVPRLLTVGNLVEHVKFREVQQGSEGTIARKRILVLLTPVLVLMRSTMCRANLELETLTGIRTASPTKFFAPALVQSAMLDDIPRATMEPIPPTQTKGGRTSRKSLLQ